MRDSQEIHLINQYARPNVTIVYGENNSLPWKFAELSSAYVRAKSMNTNETLLIGNLPLKVLEPGMGGKTVPQLYPFAGQQRSKSEL